MSSRTLEKLFVGSALALIAAIINQVFAGKIDYLWAVGGFVGAMLMYGGYQGFNRFPFTKFRVTNVRDGKGLLFHRDVLEGKRVGEAWQFKASRHDWAIYGPYLHQPLRKGKYTVMFRVKVDNVTGENCPIVDIDVACWCNGMGAKRLAGRTLSTFDFKRADEYHNFALDFLITSDERELEFRVFSRNSGHDVTLDFCQFSQSTFSNLVRSAIQ